MPKRADAEQVKLNLRMRGALHKKLVRDADRRDVSLNTAIVERLEQSFRGEQTVAEALELAYGPPHLQPLFKMMAAALEQVEAATGKRCSDDILTYTAVRAAWLKIVDQIWTLSPELREQLARLAQAADDINERLGAATSKEEVEQVQVRFAAFRSELDKLKKPIEAAEQQGSTVALGVLNQKGKGD